MEAEMVHKVAVIGCGCESKVVPGAIVVSNNDTVEVTGVDSEIHVWFPWMAPGESVRVGNKDKRVVLKIANLTPRTYQYGVYHVETRSMSQGNSSPIIIVDR
jgi:hypothetical protein